MDDLPQRHARCRGRDRSGDRPGDAGIATARSTITGCWSTRWWRAARRMARSPRAAARRCWSRRSTIRRRGRCVAGSFMDYPLPRADDLPSFSLAFNPTRCTTNPLGVKGAGEAGMIAAFPAIHNAIHDALAAVGGKRFRRARNPSAGLAGDAEIGEEQMSDYEHILVEIEDGVGIMTLNRPDKLNAMNRKLSSELRDAVKAMDADDDVGCIVITGAGPRLFRRRRHPRAARGRPPAHRCRAGRCAAPAASYEIGACAKPTIGMMNGLAYGGAGVLAVVARHADRLRGLANSASSPPPMAGSTAPGRCPTRSAGRSPRSCCFRRASSRPRRRIASGC